MLGDSALHLVQDASRSQSTNLLRPYLDEQVRLLARETRSLNDQIKAGQAILSQIQEDDASFCQLTVAALHMRRNKRAMLIYHSQRLDLLRDLLWDASVGQGASNLARLLNASSNTTSNSEQVRKNLSPSELDFLRSYSGLVREYKTAYIDAVDLSSPVMDRPPKELHCQVRVLRDIGEIETSSGSISFRKGTLVFVRRSDVDKLIASGALEEVAE